MEKLIFEEREEILLREKGAKVKKLFVRMPYDSETSFEDFDGFSKETIQKIKNKELSFRGVEITAIIAINRGNNSYKEIELNEIIWGIISDSSKEDKLEILEDIWVNLKQELEILSIDYSKAKKVLEETIDKKEIF